MTPWEQSIIQRALSLVSLNRFCEAGQELLRLLSQFPENAEAIAWLGYCKLSDGKVEEGIGDIKRALGLSPQEAHIHYLLAHAYYELRHVDEAHQSIREALLLVSDYAEYIALNACILLAQQKSLKAIDEAKRALALDPENLTALNVLAIAFFRMDRVDESEAAIRTALKIAPMNDTYHALLGRKKMNDGNSADAFEAFREALRLNPNKDEVKTSYVIAMKGRYRLYDLYLKYCRWRDSRDSQVMSTLDTAFILIIAGLFLAAISSVSLFVKVLCFVVVVPMVFISTVEPIADFLLSLRPHWRYTIEADKRWLFWPTAMGLIVTLIGLVLLIAGNEYGLPVIILGVGSIVLFGGLCRDLSEKQKRIAITAIVLILAFGIQSLVPALRGADFLLTYMFGMTALAFRWFVDRPRYY